MTQATVVRYTKGTMFFDGTGKPLAGGCLWYFQAGTMTPQSVYLDSGGTTVFSSGSVNGIPYIQLDSSGRLTNTVYLGPVANYKEYLTDYTGASSGIVGGNTISPWPEDNIPCAATASTTQQVPTGTLRAYIGSVVPSGYVLSSGLTIGNPSSSATGRANSDTQSLFVLMWNSDLTNTYFVVGGGRGSSALVDFNANKTITLPDLRGRTIFGLDNMGGSAAGRIVGSGTYTGSMSAPTAIGSAGGEEAHVQTIAELVAHGHTITDPGHTHTMPATTIATGGGAGRLVGGADTSQSTGSATTGITINNSGGGGGHNNMPPAMMLNWIVKL